MKPSSRHAECDASKVIATLSSWYDANPVVRRAWAIEGAAALRVFVLLEPTPDGNDVLPNWLGNYHRWTRDLQALTNRTVWLGTTFDEPHVDADAIVIAELNWRDPWASP